MPRLSVYFIRTSLIYMMSGFTFGGLILANKGIPFWPTSWVMLPFHIEFLLMGWVLQLAMGVIFWILPRFSQGPSRGREWLIWLAYLLVNLGIILVGLQSSIGNTLLGITGKVVLFSSAAIFVGGNWKRIKSSGQ